MLYEAKFKLEAITPIYMRGANQNKVEIRAPSIKGLMRWWFRALAGNYFGGNINELKNAESFVFGSTEKKSRVYITVHENFGQKPEPLIYGIRYDERRKLKPNYHRDSYVAKLSYLLFSVKFQANDLFRYIGNEKRWRAIDIEKELKKENIFFYPPGTSFSIEIRSWDEKAFNLALISFWALVSLGGVGFRNRRGAGSLKFIDGDLKKLHSIELETDFTNENNFKRSVEKSIEMLGNYLPQPRNIIGNLTPQKYPILNPNTSYVGVIDFKLNNPTPLDCLYNFQSEYQRFRRDRNNFLRRVVFGLPIIKSNIRGYDLKSKRRGSPMLVGVIYIADKPYVRVVKFKTDPYYKYRNDPVNSIADWKALRDFNKKFREIQIFGNLGVF